MRAQHQALWNLALLAGSHGAPKGFVQAFRDRLVALEDMERRPDQWVQVTAELRKDLARRAWALRSARRAG